MIPSRDLFPRFSAKLDSWSFTGEFGRNFERLVNLQMWCFGCDIRRQESSLLTRYGFTKTRPPATIHGSTRYSRTRNSGYSIHLWGFGMIIADGRVALCVKRFERTPKILEGSFDPTHIFKPHDLPPFREPRGPKERSLARTLLQHLFEELHGYETYLSTISHPAYRRECVQTSPKTGRLKGRREPCEAWALLASRRDEADYASAGMGEGFRGSREGELHLPLLSLHLNHVDQQYNEPPPCSSPRIATLGSSYTWAPPAEDEAPHRSGGQSPPLLSQRPRAEEFCHLGERNVRGPSLDISLRTSD